MLPKKDPDAGKDWTQEEEQTTEDEMVGWHHRLDGHEFEQAPELVMDREACSAAVHRSQRVGHNWATNLNWTEHKKVPSPQGPSSEDTRVWNEHDHQ